MTDTPKTLREMPRDEAIAIFEHWLNTGQVCQYDSGQWATGFPNVLVNWTAYRLPVTYPTVDWSHVADWVQYIAFGEDGESLASDCEPLTIGNYWAHDEESKVSSADTIASLTRGTCDWKDSLISRPVEGKK